MCFAGISDADQSERQGRQEVVSLARTKVADPKAAARESATRPIADVKELIAMNGCFQKPKPYLGLVFHRINCQW